MIVTDPGGLAIGGPAARPLPRSVSLLAPGDIAYLVMTAARAPSVHNTQPWKFRVCGRSLELHADPARLLRFQDPAGRELVISCGAALFGLRLACRKLGFVVNVELLPDPARPWLVASIEPVGLAALSRPESELLAAVPHRHTHRGPFSPGELPLRLLPALSADAAAEGARLVGIEDAVRLAALRDLVLAAAADQRASAQVRAELRRWVRPAGSLRRDGVPASARVGPGDLAAERDWMPPRDFGLPGTELPGGVPPSVTLVLTTARDTPADWLRAGQALHRLLLHAASRWVFARLQSQPLEIPRYRAQVREQLGLPGHPQMILQLGRANVAAATARRPQAELIQESGTSL
jgi:nitroreductase